MPAGKTSAAASKPPARRRRLAFGRDPQRAYRHDELGGDEHAHRVEHLGGPRHEARMRPERRPRARDRHRHRQRARRPRPRGRCTRASSRRNPGPAPRPGTARVRYSLHSLAVSRRTIAVATRRSRRSTWRTRSNPPRSKRVQPGLVTTAFVLVPAWAALSQRRRGARRRARLKGAAPERRLGVGTRGSKGPPKCAQRIRTPDVRSAAASRPVVRFLNRPPPAPAGSRRSQPGAGRS